MAEPRRLDLAAHDGRPFTVMASMDSGPHDRFTIRFGTDLGGVFTDDDMANLVEFIGYPTEGTERADAAEAQIAVVEVALVAVNAELGAREQELSRVRVEVGTLVDALKGAWWLEAASSYHQLADWAKR